MAGCGGARAQTRQTATLREQLEKRLHAKPPLEGEPGRADRGVASRRRRGRGRGEDIHRLVTPPQHNHAHLLSFLSREVLIDAAAPRTNKEQQPPPYSRSPFYLEYIT